MDQEMQEKKPEENTAMETVEKEIDIPQEPPKTENEAMMLALQSDIRALRDTLNKEKEQKEEAERKLKEEQENKDQLNNIVTKVRERESDKHSKKFETEIKPFLTNLKADESTSDEVKTAIDNLSSNIENVIKKTGFVGSGAPKEEEMYTVLSACASAQQINSSTLAKILANEAKNAQKIEEQESLLKNSKDQISKLKAELEKFNKDNSNPASHFENNDVPKVEVQDTQPQMISAVASAASTESKKPAISPLFDMKPMNNWRSAWKNP